jgi:hypothetical protein
MAYQRSHNGVLSNTIEGGKKLKTIFNKTGKGTSLSGNLNIALMTSILEEHLIGSIDHNFNIK